MLKLVEELHESVHVLTNRYIRECWAHEGVDNLFGCPYESANREFELFIVCIDIAISEYEVFRLFNGLCHLFLLFFDVTSLYLQYHEDMRSFCFNSQNRCFLSILSHHLTMDSRMVNKK